MVNLDLLAAILKFVVVSERIPGLRVCFDRDVSILIVMFVHGCIYKLVKSAMHM